jgi:hypothetical protein
MLWIRSYNSIVIGGAPFEFDNLEFSGKFRCSENLIFQVNVETIPFGEGIIFLSQGVDP